MRTGVIAKKMGMMRLFNEDGRHVPVTVLALEGCQVVGARNADKDGYFAVRLGAGARKAKNVNKPQRGEFAKAQVEPKARVAEFRVDNADGLLPVGASLSADHFVDGQLVDITGHTQGRLCRRHEALGLRWYACIAWCVHHPPCPWFDWPAPGSRQGVQE